MLGHNTYVIGVDIGKTTTLVALVNGNGEILHQIEFPTLPEHGWENTLSTIVEAVTSLECHIPERGIWIGIGISSAGVINCERISIVYASNLGWHNAEVGTILKERFNVPVRIGNDANVAAVAEYVWGAKKEMKDLIYITVSTGIGAGIINGGQLLKGESYSAGEFGHITIDVMGQQCRCGNYGCLENYCSGTAIANIANRRLGKLKGRSWTTKDVFDAARNGNGIALDIVKVAGIYLGNSIVSLIHLFNPTKVILGGGIINNDNLLFEEAYKTINNRCLPTMRNQVTVQKTSFGREIGVLGAAGIFFMDAANSQ
ncbi:MAG: ROK family protein [Candidatus Pristimantibacillus lignocellulolyticus]|uniref:ROK family protein n=1 Tax=Candidatus Pristimantibacillus lignocellulolyticus TaxID=2994561 RepID=A0A9J6Z8Z4_9BACL|nr:MAG: ROK family protein [Candidatus Pristimantibacillus lignocellulolyticus]